MSDIHRTTAERSVAALTRLHPSIVVAVSGGLDSTCLAHMARGCHAPGSRLRVATFDHGSGPHATRAIEHVVAMAARLGLPVDVGRSERDARSESAWRADRWRFLLRVAAQHEAVVATAHTLDDQIETVVMRILRGAGARGLAGLLTDSSPIVRPFVHVPRADLANYAKRHGLAWVEDPTNVSRRYLRNRVRLDLLPALIAADPSLPGDLLRLSKRAAALRWEMEGLVAPWVARQRGGLLVSKEVLGLPDIATRAAAWPAILGPHHVILDRRGIIRLAGLGLETSLGSTVTLSGGWSATRVAEGVRVRRGALDSVPKQEIPTGGRVQFGDWTFEIHAEPPGGVPDDAWSAWIPWESTIHIRGWQDGDRIAAGPAGRPRRVKRFFADNRIAAIDRKGWPVVVANGEIIWIPGIRRATAASARSGRPARLVVCERIHH